MQNIEATSCKLVLENISLSQSIDPIIPLKNNKYKVTAIVSTYNSELYFKGCLENLLAQTLYLNGQLEILIIDSGSQQNEGKYALEFQKKYPHIQYLRTSRETLYAAWNRAIKLSQASYLTNANTDDRQHSHAFEIMAQVLDARTEGVVYSDALLTHVENETFSQNTANVHWKLPDFNLRQALIDCPFGCQVMWRRTLHESVGSFDESYCVAGDYEFFLRASRKSGAYHISKPLALYFENEKNLSYVNAAKVTAEVNRILEYYRVNIPIEEIYPELENDKDKIFKATALADFANLLINSRARLGYKEAIIRYREAIEMGGPNPEILNNLGIALSLSGEIEEAISVFSRLDKSNPTIAANFLSIQKHDNASHFKLFDFQHSILEKLPAIVFGDSTRFRLRPSSQTIATNANRKKEELLRVKTKVLWQSREDLDALPGGDGTVFHETLKAMKSFGIAASSSLSLSPDLKDYEIVQLNNISRTKDTHEQIVNAKRQNKKIVVHALYEDMDRYLISSNKMDMLFHAMAKNKHVFSFEQIKEAFDKLETSNPLATQYAKYFGIGDKLKQQEILNYSDMILTSGKTESELLIEKFSIKVPIQEISYGFNSAFKNAKGNLFTQKYGLKDFVLCVGRVEPRKNQCTLIEVFRKLPHLKLVLIGDFHDLDLVSVYKNYAASNVYFFNRLPFEELVSAFGAARLHVLPSWYELPGLVSLEAAAAGCRIVSTSWGTAKDYFGDRIHYCEPDQPESIKRAILESFDSDSPKELCEYVNETFSWEKTAQQILDCYSRL